MNAQVSELKKKCKDLGISVIGNKTELVTRIQDHINSGGDDSVLNEAELLGELDGSDSQVVSNVDEDLLLGDSTTESKEDKNEMQTASNPEPIAKIAEPEIIAEVVEEPAAKLSKIDIEATSENEIPAKPEISEEQVRWTLLFIDQSICGSLCVYVSRYGRSLSSI